MLLHAQFEVNQLSFSQFDVSSDASLVLNVGEAPLALHDEQEGLEDGRDDYFHHDGRDDVEEYEVHPRPAGDEFGIALHHE